MRIQTYTTVVGNMACNARCAFCIAKQTPETGLLPKLKDPVNHRNLEIGARLAQANGVTTALITGKGEPTLFPEELGVHVLVLRKYFPLIELQTNGLLINQNWNPVWKERLTAWRHEGLTTVAISIVHWEPDKNHKIYTPHREDQVYQDLEALIEKLHSVGLSVRLTLMMYDGCFDSPDDVVGLMEFAKKNKVEQVTIRPIKSVDIDEAENREVAQWTLEHELDDQQLVDIINHVRDNATLVMTLPHGAEVYDYDGQNICLTDCLTIRPDSDDLRQLIFFPDGALRYDWRYEGARLL